MKKTALISFSGTMLVPALALAQQFGYVNNVVDEGAGWLDRSIVIIMVLMTLFFLIGVFRYISEKEAAKLPERRKMMLNGLLGLFIAVSVWGIIKIAGNIVGTNGNNAPVGLTCPPGTYPVGNSCQ